MGVKAANVFKPVGTRNNIELRSVFRAKKHDWNKGNKQDEAPDEWVQGYVVNNPIDGWVILAKSKNPPDRDPMWNHLLINYKIDVNTASQCTGYFDNNSNLIFENDIVRAVEDGKEAILVVVWDQSEMDFKFTNGKVNYGSEFMYMTNCDEIEVLGNIIDNPDLLKKYQ